MFERKCFYCGETMNQITTSTTCGWGKYKFTLEGITAYVCPKCGEKVYDAQEAKLIQEIGRAFSALNNNERIPENEILNVKETADLLRISVQSVYNMIKDGRLHAVKVGREWRFMRKDLESIINPQTFQIAARNEKNKISESDYEKLKKHFDSMSM